jgi:hypothetical protein
MSKLTADNLKFYSILVNGLFKAVPEVELTKEQLSELFTRLLEKHESYPRIVRGWLAELILQQNGITVVPPGKEEPKYGKKENRKVQKVIIKDEKKDVPEKAKTYTVIVQGKPTQVTEEALTMDQLKSMMQKLVGEVSDSPRIVRSWLADKIFKLNGLVPPPIGVPLPKVGTKENRKIRKVTVKDKTVPKNTRSKPKKDDPTKHVL